MPRAIRRIEAGAIYHVLNRGNGRRTLFSKEKDFEAFVNLMQQAFGKYEVDLLAFCLMKNHWHLLVRPRSDQALARCMAWMTVTHARRHHMHYPNPGSGHLYQGRFKSFPVQSDEHFLQVARYIHANPIRAGAVKRVREWRWNDLSGIMPTVDWPVDRPPNWMSLVDREVGDEERDRIEISIRRGTPFGSAAWMKRTAARQGLGSTLTPRGRPRKPAAALSRRQLQRRAKEESGNAVGQKSR